MDERTGISGETGPAALEGPVRLSGLVGSAGVRQAPAGPLRGRCGDPAGVLS
ncbi:hypothetical protein [Streptomyces griseorubiginosus]|uniref:hypothetical protein n=1 Tax=Streptomyces griseorubiginosus TaxID=67304 RepID=UPI002E809BDE|nr:hypothetical protein [Streptomyces griseorubiginosus]WUB48114.1 hypothetical protein OHN19_34155 [Streptomyces griseorubiginosus]WUB56639.1 hypothetical protein OG942_34165 [Streptomyces griseorubiginosus]